MLRPTLRRAAGRADVFTVFYTYSGDYASWRLGGNCRGNCRGQGSGVRGQGSGVRGQGSGVRGQRLVRRWRGLYALSESGFAGFGDFQDCWRPVGRAGVRGWRLVRRLGGCGFGGGRCGGCPPAQGRAEGPTAHKGRQPLAAPAERRPPALSRLSGEGCAGTP